jgi:thymidylate synthase (FAD)
MKIVNASYQIESDLNGSSILRSIEKAGRTCYKSEDRITDESAIDFVKMILKRGHESVIEHQSFSVRFIVDRGVSHEIVRHRLASFSQESTRFCNYSKDKFDSHVCFIAPHWINQDLVGIWDYQDITDKSRAGMDSYTWLTACRDSEKHYLQLLDIGWQPQHARSVLPNSVKTEIVVTANLREWRTIFKQRTDRAAHPQMREVMIPLLKEIKRKIPVIFDDIEADQRALCA